MVAAPLWALGAVGLYVDSYEPSRKAIWAELQVIEDDETTLHYYGSESPRRSLRAHFWDRANWTTLQGYAGSGTTRTLTGPHALNEDLKILDIRARRIPDKTGEAAAATGEFYQVELEVIVV